MSEARGLYSFTKPGGHRAEIREFALPQIKGLEFVMFVDGSPLISELFQSDRVTEYAEALSRRVAYLTEMGWVPEFD